MYFDGFACGTTMVTTAPIGTLTLVYICSGFMRGEAGSRECPDGYQIVPNEEKVKELMSSSEAETKSFFQNANRVVKKCTSGCISGK